MRGYPINIFVLILTILPPVVRPFGANECEVTKYDQVDSVLKNCTDIVITNLTVPAGKQLALNIREGSTVTFRGKISFEHEYWAGSLLFITGNNFTMRGEVGSVIDGNGSLYWDGKGTGGNYTKPQFIKMYVQNAVMENITLHNCPVSCVMIRKSENLTIRNWVIDVLDGDEGVAPPNKYAHNTDGFTVGSTNNFLLENAVVFNQDDCVAISSGRNMTFRNMFCHGSHGLSVSAGGAVLQDVLVEDSLITFAENGIRVKCHIGTPPGLVKNITYRNITILDSKFYGIIVQQNYEALPEGVPIDGPPDNHIPVYDLKLSNIHGNVQSGAVPVFILCAEEGCFDWSWENVNVFGAAPNNCTGYSPNGFPC